MTFHFGWFLGAGFGVQGWGEPGYGIGYDWKQPGVYREAVKTLEGAGFDLFIIEDSLTVPDTYGGNSRVNLGQARFAPKHDPLVLAPLLFEGTYSIGIVPTISASFYPPFTAARQLATIQHFAGGRLGWNVVTSGSDLAAQNYGMDGQLEHDLRYDKAAEWVDVVRRLWRSWEPDAVVEDLAGDLYADYTKVNPINHRGRFFQVRGPLNTVPMPEEPVMVQAGASGKGREFAGQNADVVIALASSPERMKAYRDSVRDVAAAAGRNPDHVKILFVLSPLVVANDEEAAEVRRKRSTLTQRSIDDALATISYLSVTDFSQFELDEPLPDVTTNSNQGTLDNFIRSAPPGSTLRQILQARADNDGQYIIGTADQLADHMAELGEAIGGDGFLFQAHAHPASIHRTVDKLVPALRARNLIRTEFGSTSFRSNLLDF